VQRSCQAVRALYTDAGGQAAIFPQFWVCCAACSACANKRGPL